MGKWLEQLSELIRMSGKAIFMRMLALSVIPACLASATGAQAAPTTSDAGLTTISIQGSATQQITKDVLTIRFLVSANGPSLAKVNSAVDHNIDVFSKEWEGKPKATFLKDIKLVQISRGKDVKNSTQRSWIVESNLTIIAPLSDDLIEFLQHDRPGVTITSIGSSISPVKWKSVESDLMKVAMADFRGKADAISAAAGGKSYSIISLNMTNNILESGSSKTVDVSTTGQDSGDTSGSKPGLSDDPGNSIAIMSISGAIRVNP